jgi:hypothetical protein
MTQNTNTARTIANLTASILRATGAVRDNNARALSAHAPIDLVSMLVAASARHQTAEAALDQADTTLTNAIAAVRKMIRTDTGRNANQAINAIATGARTYVAALNRGNDDERALAQTLFINEITDVTAMMATPEGRAEVPTLAFAAMSYAMAEATEIATKEGYRSIQAVIQERATA